MWLIWRDLKYGSAKWNSVLREVLVRYEMCDMVRNDGVMWTVTWFGIMCVGNGNGNVIHSTSHLHSSTVFHIGPHFRHSTPYHISHHTYLIPPDHRASCG